jgi:hypothetical protein
VNHARRLGIYLTGITRPTDDNGRKRLTPKQRKRLQKKFNQQKKREEG